MQLNSKDIDNAYKQYQAILGICNYTKGETIRRSKQNFDFLTTIRFPYVGDVIKNKNSGNTLEEYFEKIFINIHEAAVINIVSEFERVIFKRVDLASNNIVDVVKVNYQDPNPFYDYSISFVKNSVDIHNLSGVKNMLSADLMKELKEIIEYRNHLAHGKRQGIGSPSNMTIEQLVVKLDNLIALIK